MRKATHTDKSAPSELQDFDSSSPMNEKYGYRWNYIISRKIVQITCKQIEQ